MMTKPLLIDEIDPKIDNFEIEQIIAKYPEMPVFIGRQRAEEALNFGLDIKDGGYHIFALGPSGIGKSSTILRLLKERSGREQAPSDWCYVNNFKEAEKPIALELPAGCGRFFKDRMNEFINELRSLVPRIFESDEYVRRLNSIAKEEEFRKKETIQSFAEMAKSLNYEVNQTPFGIVLTAIRNGRPLTDLQVEELPSELRSAYEQNRNELLDEATLINRQVRKIEREGNERREKMNKEILHSAIDPYIAELRERFQNFEPVLTFIESVKGDIIENANEIKGALEEKSAQNILEQTLFADSEKLSIFNKYSVNLFVGDGNKGAPIVLESLPTVPHLVGRFEFRSRLGGVTTDFTMLRPGALQSANGGYLILDAIELLTQPFSWSVLKNTIQSGEIRLEEIGERLPFSVPTPTLRPEPIPLRAKIILVGPPMVYYLLTLYDKDFLELFRVKADFDTETEFRGEDRDKFIAFIYHFAKSELKTNISKQGIAEIIREASRLREHQTRVTLDYRQLTDILKEASFWSKDHGHEIDASDIQKAVDKKIFRSNLIEEKIQQYIEEGTIYVDTSGEKVGTVNGLSVIQLGDYEFGKPTRITSRTYAGRDGVVDIQRQSQLSGPIHGKAVMILAIISAVVLRRRFRWCSTLPLPLSRNTARSRVIVQLSPRLWPWFLV